MTVVCVLGDDAERLAGLVPGLGAPVPELETRTGELLAIFAEHAVRDHEAQAAQLALALRREAAGARIAVAGERSGRPDALQRASSIDRARDLATDAGIDIFVEEAVAQRLDARFDLHPTEHAFRLSERSAPAPAEPLAADRATAEHALSRWGLRFASAAAEQRYLAWHAQRVVLFVRTTMMVTTSMWLLILLWCGVATPSFATAGPWIALGTVPASACLVMTYVRRWQVAAYATSAMVNLCNGLLVIAIGYWLMKPPGPATQGVVWCSFIGFVLLRLDFRRAFATCVPFVVLHLALTIVHFANNAPWLVRGLVPTLASFLMAALIGAVLARSSRETYRQDQVSDAQQRDAERQQAEIEKLSREADARQLTVLGAELRRQVAARSRNLADALTRKAGHRLHTGDVIEGRYQVVRAIGEGGMGRVYEVERLADARRMALKVLNEAASPTALARFAREAHIAAALDHPNVVPALDVGITPAGSLFVVMQLVNGPSLAAERSRFGDAAWAVPILIQVADALVAMHAQGIIHRDLKPENVLLDGDRALVADFGIARTSAALGPSSLTQTGVVVGTVPYVAPEMVEGGRRVSARIDVFSFGVLSFLLLTGKLPHVVPPLVARRSGTVSPARKLAVLRPDLPAPLAALIDGCLAERPGSRPNALELVARLRRFARPELETAAPALEPAAPGDHGTGLVTTNARPKRVYDVDEQPDDSHVHAIAMAPVTPHSEQPVEAPSVIPQGTQPDDPAAEPRGVGTKPPSHTTDERIAVPATPPDAARTAPAVPPPHQRDAVLTRWGAAFTDAALEASYRIWNATHAVAYAQLGMIVALIVWPAAMLWVTVRDPAWQLVVAAGIGMLPPLLCLALSVRRQWQPWISTGAGLALLVTGAGGVALAWTLRNPLVATYLVLWFSYIGLGVLRLNLTRALLFTLPIALVHQAMLLRGLSNGTVNAVFFLSEAIVPWSHFVSAVVAASVLSRVTHEAFFRARMLEAQRQEAQRQRAEVERLEHEAAQREMVVLGSELRRHVAARSRHLMETIAQQTAPTVRFEPGSIVDDRYRIIRMIGEGGMGRVYEVERLADHRRLALKVLKRDPALAEQARFAREAQIAAELQHRHVVAALDIGATTDGTMFLVMQLVEGPSLAALANRHGDPGWALPILRQIASALVAMHAAGVVHRDLKPENVLLDGDAIKVVDFGIAGLHDPSAPAAQDIIRGTPAYMAPELAQVRDRDQLGAVDRSADVFSFGVLAHQLLTGRLPHTIAPILARMSRQTVTATKLADACPGLPGDLSRVLDACLLESPELRPTAARLAEAFRRATIVGVDRTAPPAVTGIET